MKLGVIQLIKNIPKDKEKNNEEDNQNNIEDSSKLNIPIYPTDLNNLNQIINQMFNGKIPVLAINSDFQIGHSLVYDLFLEEGTYIIVPMTMGYCMQTNPKIAFKKYVIGNDKKELPLHKTAISKFLDDLFYINDPFCKNYLPFNIIREINKGILDSKGNPASDLDEMKLLNEYSKIGNIELDTTENFGLSRLSFKNMVYELLNPLKDDLIIRTISNLGYEENTYPYLNKLINISFYFEKQKNSKSDMITIIPKNNLIDSNIDTIINIKLLDNNKENRKGNAPSRVTYKNENDSWFTIEGCYMKSSSTDKRNIETKKYTYSFTGEPNEKKKVYFSTFKNDLKVQVYPGNLVFVTYVVEDLFDKAKHDYNEDDDEETEEKNSEDKSEESNDNSFNNSSISRKSKEEDNGEESKVSKP